MWEWFGVLLNSFTLKMITGLVPQVLVLNVNSPPILRKHSLSFLLRLGTKLSIEESNSVFMMKL